MLICPLVSLGQKVTVTCKAGDKNNAHVPYAAMQVSSVADSAKEHYEAITDSVGSSTFTLDSGQKYVVRVNAMGYKPALKNIFVKGTRPIYTVSMEQDATMLKDVGITYKRPLLRQEDDKTIVDPEDLAASSTNAYDIMEKIPGVFVDDDNNIYIASTTPATIYINGREQKMSNADVAAMLKSLPPNSVERIEIMRTPSSKYDASSSGGIVNVILKKGVRIGLTGSLNAGMNQGTYGNQFAGVVVNNNNGKFSTSINLQVSNRATGEQLKTDRVFGGDSVLSQNAYTKYPGSSVYGSYSIGYMPGNKWDITYDGRISGNQNKTMSSSPSVIEQISTGAQSVNYNTVVNNSNNNLNLTQGLSAKCKTDTAGSEWTTDLSYNYMPTDGTQAYNTAYTLPVYGVIAGDGAIKSDLQFLSFQSDMVQKLPYKSSIEGGLKLTGVTFDNNTMYTIGSRGIKINDPRRTNAYNYNERIYAGYVQASKDLACIQVKAGMRLENTNMDGHQVIPADTSFKLTRTDLFPYLYISRKVMKIAGYELRAYLIYRRTILRPTYEYLNPFPKYVDQYLSETGNPMLRPQFTKNYEANISVDERPLLAIGYNDMKDIFSQVVYQVDSSHRQTYRTYDNLGSNKEVYFRALGAIPPGGTYFFVLGAQYNHNFYEGLYEGAPLSYKRGSWTFFTYHTLKLSKLTQMTMNGFVKFNGQSQFYELGTFGMLSMSINHQFLNKKLKVTMNVSDIFLTNNNTFSIDQGTIAATGLRKGDTRRFGLNVAYNFGVRKKEDHNFMNVESPENNSK